MSTFLDNVCIAAFVMVFGLVAPLMTAAVIGRLYL